MRERERDWEREREKRDRLGERGRNGGRGWEREGEIEKGRKR